MVFADAGPLPRHPSQLYQAALEGGLLFVIVWLYSARPRPVMAVSGMFLVGYGALRFIGEFAREPDAFLGFVAFDWLTMGQLLCLPMLVAGAALLMLSRRHRAA
jgi:phosphatidylglycerol:prolipoprotein diacylglycerol transferase